jgi:hypothetical protein
MKSSNSVPFYACLVEEVRSGAVPEKRNRNSLEIRNDTVLKIPSNPRAHVPSISFLSAHRHGRILPRTTLEPGVAASFSCTTLKPVATTSSFLVHLSLSLLFFIATLLLKLASGAGHFQGRSLSEKDSNHWATTSSCL